MDDLYCLSSVFTNSSVLGQFLWPPPDCTSTVTTRDRGRQSDFGKKVIITVVRDSITNTLVNLVALLTAFVLDLSSAQGYTTASIIITLYCM